MKESNPRMSRRLLLFLLPLLFLSQLYAAIEARYIPESNITFEVKPGPWTHPSVIGAKLGTLTITSSTGEIHNPGIVHVNEIPGTIYIRGLARTWSGGTPVLSDIQFWIMTLTYINGGGNPIVQAMYSGRWPLISWSNHTIYASSITVEFYLVNTNNLGFGERAASNFTADLFELNTPYLLPAGFNPYFSVAVGLSTSHNVGWYADGNGNVNPNLAVYVPVDGVAGADSTPLFGPGSFTNPDNPNVPGFLYGDLPDPPVFLLYFQYPSVSFTVDQAIGSRRVTINQANLVVQNGEEGKTYSLDLKFKDNSNKEGFMLLPPFYPAYGLAYDLYFDGRRVREDVPITWEGITPSNLNNTKELQIGGINETVAMSLLEGTYSGTITVTITNQY